MHHRPERRKKRKRKRKENEKGRKTLIHLLAVKKWRCPPRLRGGRSCTASPDSKNPPEEAPQPDPAHPSKLEIFTLHHKKRNDFIWVRFPQFGHGSFHPLGAHDDHFHAVFLDMLARPETADMRVGSLSGCELASPLTDEAGFDVLWRFTGLEAGAVGPGSCPSGEDGGQALLRVGLGNVEEEFIDCGIV